MRAYPRLSIKRSNNLVCKSRVRLTFLNCASKLGKLVLFSWCLLVMSSRQLPATGSFNAGKLHFYVSPQGNDANDGSARQPWRTMQHAATAAGPGATVHVAPGSYFGQIITRSSGTAQSRIRFLSEVKWGAKLKSINAYSTWRTVGNYLDIIGFDISGDGCLGILNEGAHVRLIANHVHDIRASPALCKENGGAGIDNADFSAVDNDVVGNVVHDIGYYKATGSLVHGIYHSNSGGHIWNNIVYRTAGWGIHLWHAATDVQIANNLLFNNAAGGILIGAGDSPGGIINDRTVVTNNIVIYNKFGIQEYGQTGRKNQYLNNLVYRNAGGAIKLLTGVARMTLELDPRFVNFQPDGTGDYRLSASSPAVSAGTDTAAPSEDVNGLQRSHVRPHDLGPYAWSSQSQPVVPWPPALP